MVSKGFFNTKDLICCIIAVLFLLSICMTIDYADEDVIVSGNKTLNVPKDAVVVNGTEYVPLNNTAKSVIRSTSKVYYKYPVISMWAKPSVRSKYAYKWYKKTFIDYCPHCKHYRVLLKNPKGVPEREYTCKRCGADYCAVTGKEKYSWSKYYLRKA